MTTYLQTLVLVPVVAGTQLARASNESSYRYGLAMADFKAKTGCDDSDGDCNPSAVSNCHT